MRNLVIFLLTFFFAGTAFAESKEKHCSSRLTDEVLPLLTESLPERPAPLLELGNSFLNTGKIAEGLQLPTGAVWQPSLIVWGTYRTALQSFDDSNQRVTEWANRFDLYANLYLNFSERIFFAFRPLDRSGRFSRYTFDSSENSEEEGEFEDEFNFKVRSLFFEGDFGELFPLLDPNDRLGLDFAFSLGRQNISFQDGMLIDDNLDTLGVSKINLKPSWAVNYRSILLWAWDEINRTNLAIDDSSASLFGFFNEVDFRRNTLEFDLAYLTADAETGDGLYLGLGSTQRFGHYNTTFRLLSSHSIDDETEHNSDGLLLFSEFSYTPKATYDLVYLNGFYAADNYRSASRDPSAGGPLGPTGILFASVGLGRYQAALDSTADDAFGAALGYQMFFDETRKQLVFELGGRYGTEDIGERALALGSSFQSAFGRRSVIRVDIFTRYGAERDGALGSSSSDLGYGTRLEWMYRL